jgi:heme oxygenase
MERDARQLRNRLRHSTIDAHKRIDRHPLLRPLLDRSLTMPQYVLVLRTFDHFYRSFMPALADSAARHGQGFDVIDRRPWLRDDMTALACGAATFPDIVWDIPAVSTTEGHIGRLYVIEGSLLGGQYIARNLRLTLGLTPDHGARFFNGAGADTEHRWNRFLTYAETNCYCGREAAALDAAQAMFSCLERGFDEIWASTAAGSARN